MPPRRWTLFDASDDFNPRWKIGDGTPPPALEYGEEVVVMPVSEHEAMLIELARPSTVLRTHGQREALADDPHNKRKDKR